MERYGLNPEQGRKQVQVHNDDRICKTCEACVKDVGKWIPYNEPFSNGLMFAIFHIGCRCNTSFSMFNPDQPTAGKRPTRRKETVEVTPEKVPEVVETPETIQLPTTRTEAEKYIEKHFNSPVSFKGLKEEDAIIASIEIKAMFNKMPFLDNIPALNIRRTKNARAMVYRSRKTSETISLDISGVSFNHKGVNFVERTERQIENLKKLLDGETDVRRQTQYKNMIKKEEAKADVWTVGSNLADDRHTVIIHEF